MVVARLCLARSWQNGTQRLTLLIRDSFPPSAQGFSQLASLVLSEISFWRWEVCCLLEKLQLDLLLSVKQQVCQAVHGLSTWTEVVFSSGDSNVSRLRGLTQMRLTVVPKSCGLSNCAKHHTVTSLEIRMYYELVVPKVAASHASPFLPRSGTSPASLAGIGKKSSVLGKACCCLEGCSLTCGHR